MLLTCYQLLHLEQWDIVTCGGRYNFVIILLYYMFTSIFSYRFVVANSYIFTLCYFLFPGQGWSFSDAMFVTKHNMANAVATVSKQLENLSETLAVSRKGCLFFALRPLLTCIFDAHSSFVQSTKKHLAKRLENLEWKAEELNETSKHIANDVWNYTS